MHMTHARTHTLRLAHDAAVVQNDTHTAAYTATLTATHTTMHATAAGLLRSNPLQWLSDACVDACKHVEVCPCGGVFASVPVCVYKY